VRSEFVGALVELAERDERVVLLTGDLGFTVLEGFAERFPERFYNVGVAEQNMLGIATGLAEAGFVPFAYSIATFASMRPYEFFRNGAVLHELPVRLVGVGGGLDYGHNGVTHYALEDVALMRAQPGLTIVAPADGRRARQAVARTADLPGPAYFRIGKVDEPMHGLGDRFELGRAATLGEGGDVALVALGAIAGEVVRAQDLLARRGISASVTVVESVSPPPVGDLVAALGRAPLAIAVEAHYASGGLGSLVAEVIAEHGLRCRLVRRAVHEVPRGLTGSLPYLYGELGLSAEKVAELAVASFEPAAG
jgi:transketolase